MHDIKLTSFVLIRSSDFSVPFILIVPLIGMLWVLNPSKTMALGFKWISCISISLKHLKYKMFFVAPVSISILFTLHLYMPCWVIPTSRMIGVTLASSFNPSSFFEKEITFCSLRSYFGIRYGWFRLYIRLLIYFIDEISRVICWYSFLLYPSIFVFPRYILLSRPLELVFRWLFLIEYNSH